jgi:hypothetical protein
MISWNASSTSVLMSRWFTPGTGQRVSKADIEKRNVLFQNEDKGLYISKILKKTLVR